MAPNIGVAGPAPRRRLAAATLGHRPRAAGMEGAARRQVERVRRFAGKPEGRDLGIGRHGREFTAWKFRTMRKESDRLLKEYLAAHPEARIEWARTQKLVNDPRITRVGRLLRRASLDELPQLWNIFLGQMSLVGPRPIVASEVANYGESFTYYCRVSPGLTGLWQVSGRNHTTYPERVGYDEYYVCNWSVWMDIYILLRTIKVVLTGEGAY